MEGAGSPDGGAGGSRVGGGWGALAGASPGFARRQRTVKQPFNAKNAKNPTQRARRTGQQPKAHAKSAKDAKEQPGKQREETGKGRVPRGLFPGCGCAFPEFAWAAKDAKGTKGEQERRGRITGARGGLGREKGEWRARRRWGAGGTRGGDVLGRISVVCREEWNSQTALQRKGRKGIHAESAKNSPTANISRKVRQGRKGTAKKTRGRGRQGVNTPWPLPMMRQKAVCVRLLAVRDFGLREGSAGWEAFGVLVGRVLAVFWKLGHRCSFGVFRVRRRAFSTWLENGGTTFQNVRFGFPAPKTFQKENKSSISGLRRGERFGRMPA